MGKLSLVSTPIGNLEDITIRALRVLTEADSIACEDTRRTGLLLQEIQKRYPDILKQYTENTERKLVRLDNFTEQNATVELIGALEKGKNVALVSDAGTPLLNDPGYLLVKEALKRDIQIEAVPGPSALLAALVSAGLPLNTFTFLGYPPEKQGHRMKILQSLLAIHEAIGSTFVFYAAPHKFQSLLEDLNTVFGDIDITICRELTKVHEEIWKGTISEAIAQIEQFKGELVLVFRLEK